MIAIHKELTPCVATGRLRLFCLVPSDTRNPCRRKGCAARRCRACAVARCAAANLNLVVKLVGQEEAARQIEGLVKSKIGNKGFEGIDPHAPSALSSLRQSHRRYPGPFWSDIRREIVRRFTRKPEPRCQERQERHLHLQEQQKHRRLLPFRKQISLHHHRQHREHSGQKPRRSCPGVAPRNATISILARVDQVPNEVKLIALAQLEETFRVAGRMRPRTNRRPSKLSPRLAKRRAC